MNASRKRLNQALTCFKVTSIYKYHVCSPNYSSVIINEFESIKQPFSRLPQSKRDVPDSQSSTKVLYYQNSLKISSHSNQAFCKRKKTWD